MVVVVEVGKRPPPVVTRDRNDLKTLFFISSEIFSFEPNLQRTKPYKFVIFNASATPVII